MDIKNIMINDFGIEGDHNHIYKKDTNNESSQANADNQDTESDQEYKFDHL